MSAAPSAPSARPREILAAVGRVYPTLWLAVDRLRAMRADDFPEWPDWCFLPMQGAYAILSGGGDRRVPLDRIHHVGIVAARLGRAKRAESPAKERWEIQRLRIACR